MADMDAKPAFRRAVAGIKRFLGHWYADQVLAEQRIAERIAARWLARVKGMHDAQDFAGLAQAVINYLWQPSAASDTSLALGYYFGGFLPSWGASWTLVDMVLDGADWREVQALLHTQGYGNARQYVETFNWAGARHQAKAELKAWVAIVREEAERAAQPAVLPPASARGSTAAAAAGAMAIGTGEAAGGAGAASAASEAAAAAGRALTTLLSATAATAATFVTLMLYPRATASNDTINPVDARKHRFEAAIDNGSLVIPLVAGAAATATVLTTNNVAVRQLEANRRNGNQCEADGHAVMGQLLYTPLAGLPGSTGLDGLFEKLPDSRNLPLPFPKEVRAPQLGPLSFLPPTSQPPNPLYDYTGSAGGAVYPRFVVLEAKHISMNISDPDRIQRMAKRRLGRTRDGAQMGRQWTRERIPRALKRNGDKSPEQVDDFLGEIRQERYARWIFVCQPVGATGERQYILIDVDGSPAMRGLDNIIPKPPKAPSPAPTDTGF